MTKPKKNQGFDKKSKFLFSFRDIIKKEKSFLGKLVLQENLIVPMTIALLYMLDEFMMHSFVYTMYSSKSWRVPISLDTLSMEF